MANRIAIFLNGYLPAKKYGGPVTSIANLVDSLGDEISFHIIASDHDLDDSKQLDGIHEGWNKVGKANVLYLKENEFTVERFINVLKEIKPDLVYLSSVFSFSLNYPAIRAAKKMKIPIILAPRGELCDGALHIKYLKKKAFLSFIGIFRKYTYNGIYFQATSLEEEDAIKRHLHINSEYIFNLPNLPCTTLERNNQKKVQGSIRTVYISRIVKKKNLLYAIKCIKNCKSNVLIDIYGPQEEKDYWQLCEEEIETAPENIVIRYCGALEPGEAKTVFSKYDVFVFPTFSENYGHVIVEAISSGCHLIVTEGVTPWDDINGNGGITIPLENEKKWTNSIDKIAQMNAQEFDLFNKKLDTYVERKLALKELSEQYRDMFLSLITKEEY